MSTTQQEQTRAAAPQEYLLEMRGITKAFAGVQALKGVDFYVRPGTVHALMGENGAGKSTLMKCLFGIYHKDEGTIKLRGRKSTFSPRMRHYSTVSRWFTRNWNRFLSAA